MPDGTPSMTVSASASSALVGMRFISLGALTLMLVPGSVLEKEWKEGRFQLVSPFQSLVELKLIIENLDVTDCFFTSNHASNYLPIRARMPGQKDETLRLINSVLEKRDPALLKPEAFRAL